jgi:hypothetical protein
MELVVVWVAMVTAPGSAPALPFTLSKFEQNPVIGPSGIPGTQDACGARDMGLQIAGNTLNLVYSGYSSCSMDNEGGLPTSTRASTAAPVFPRALSGGSPQDYASCGRAGCCQLMFSTLAAPPDAKAKRLGITVPSPALGDASFYNITTDAYVLFEPPGTWHMWATEMPIANGGNGRNIGHLNVNGTSTVMPVHGWTYENRHVFPTLPHWSPDALDEPR